MPAPPSWSRKIPAQQLEAGIGRHVDPDVRLMRLSLRRFGPPRIRASDRMLLPLLPLPRVRIREAMADAPIVRPLARRRVTFRFEGGDACDVAIEDCHKG